MKARSAISAGSKSGRSPPVLGRFATCTKAAAPPRRSSCARDQPRGSPVAGGRMSDIAFDAVSRVFHRNGKAFPALDDVSFNVNDREFVAIVGPSGCGKTTCLRMAAGLEFPTSGTVVVGGRPVTERGLDRAVVFQQFALFPWKTVYENIEFGLRSKGTDPASRR